MNNDKQDENGSKKWNKQEENKKKQNKLPKYGMHRIIEL